MEQKIALVGFGTVGQGLVEILKNKKQSCLKNMDIRIPSSPSAI